MKLLKKKDIAIELARERKSQIDEGVALAKKVDEIRKLLSKEQENLRKFREVSIKTVQEEISVKLNIRDNLQKQIDGMKETVKSNQEKLNRFNRLLDK